MSLEEVIPSRLLADIGSLGSSKNAAWMAEMNRFLRGYGFLRVFQQQKMKAMGSSCPKKCFQLMQRIYRIYIPGSDLLCHFTFYPIHCWKDQFTVVRTKPQTLGSPYFVANIPWTVIWKDTNVVCRWCFWRSSCVRRCHTKMDQNGDFEAARLSKLRVISRPGVVSVINLVLFLIYSDQLAVVCFSFVVSQPWVFPSEQPEVHAFACRACASMTLKSLKASRAAKSLAEFVTCSDWLKISGLWELLRLIGRESKKNIWVDCLWVGIFHYFANVVPTKWLSDS